MIENTVFRRIEEKFFKADRDIGDKEITHIYTSETAYMEAQYYLGMEEWCYEQEENPDKFWKLAEALGKRMDRLLMQLPDGPEKYLINHGNLAGNFSPKKYEEYILPFYKKAVNN